jgi:hypothetical protein
LILRPRLQVIACPFDPAHESRIIFESVLKPVALRLEAAEQSDRLALTRDNDFLVFRLPQESAQIVLDFGQWNFFSSRICELCEP